MKGIYIKKLYKNKTIALLIIAFFIANVFSFTLNIATADNSWWDTDWVYRKQITINHSMVLNDLTNFPVLITLLSDNDLKNHAQNDGDDLVFVDSAGIQLSHEIKTYNSSTGQLIAWVKIPSLSSTTDTVFYLYYGNGASGNQQDISGTWDNNFLMVQHLDEPYGTTAEHYKDSTSHDHDGTLVGGNGSTAALIIEEAINQVSVLRGRLGSFERNTIDTNMNSLRITYISLPKQRITLLRGGCGLSALITYPWAVTGTPR